ncbi:murein biosynthesis integral membrane protein MurJ [Wenxinia saemankumensis]|uniref:Probable lipid II flippase MurJ n=1 Tax=Wenxinia saemankumensis TaxID=1447782 RepID=A0A1M6E1M7_9RHOB|nr:murein biosynthesis integral membrane protein MurJ [Wenxinia saemankumensis]SHI79309.1 putative peptidoglycan lipid II flippase [Wenxinia saemankumensis]
MKPIRLVTGFLTVGVWTLMSRVLGFARDILMAAILGTGPVAEAFLIAFSLPNMFRRFFAEGAFNMAFVPMFAKKLESGEQPERFAQEAFVAMAALLTLFTVIGIVAMPGLVWLMASGFAGDERFGLAVEYGRIAFPYILFISLAALLSGVLNATGRFAAAAAAPVLLNVVFIVALLGGRLLGVPVENAFGLGLDKLLRLQTGSTLAASVPIAGLVQLLLVWWAARRAGFAMAWRRPRLTPDLRRLTVIAVPALLAGGVVQINLLVGRQVASHFDGAVAWLSYADRLYQLPLGVIGIAVGIVLLPDLSRRLGAGDEAGGQGAFSRAAEFSLAMTLPATVALLVIPMPLVSVLFQRGAFGPDDAAATALAVMIYGLGLPAFVLQKCYQPLFYAREDTRSPFRYAVWAMVVNAAVAIGLSPVIGFAAAALATTLAGWAMVGLLWAGARRMGPAARLDARFRSRIWRIALASAGMGVILWLLQVVLITWLGSPVSRYPALALLVGGGIVCYFALAHLFGGMRITDLRRAVRR